MLSFIEKMTNWALQKEEEAAKGCRLDIEDIDKQIAIVQKKKEELQRHVRELEHIESKLRFIKGEALRCASEKDA